jgi:hypothetical protein
VGLPEFVKAEFEAFLECGVLAHGSCCAFTAPSAPMKSSWPSPVRKSFYPSCGARRMAETAAHLVDHVIPPVPVRQWVLSFPIPLRFLLAAHPNLLSPVLGVVNRSWPKTRMIPIPPLQSAACTYRIALGPQADQKVLTLQTVPSVEPPTPASP